MTQKISVRSVRPRLIPWAIGISFFLLSVVTLQREMAWTSWVLIAAGLYFNLDCRWQLREDLHGLLEEPMVFRVISWLLSAVLLISALIQWWWGDVQIGLIFAAAGLGLNPEIRGRMRLKLFRDKASKSSVENS
jgi:hypothetical protein